MVARPYFIVLNQVSCTHNTRKGYSTGSRLDGAFSLATVLAARWMEHSHWLFQGEEPRKKKT